MTQLSQLTLVLSATLWASVSLAQGLTPRPGPGMGQPPPQTETKEGPAEAAPEEEGEQAELPPLPPWPGQATKQLQLLQLRGYFRLRSDLFHNGNIGLPTTASGLQAPFYTPISELPGSQRSCADRINQPVIGGGERKIDSDGCPASTLAGANLRLRLEPTINVAETVRVHMQVDIFDNLVLGSTPDNSGGGPSTDVPLEAFADSMAPPVAGQNSRAPSILVKRAWAEVFTPFGPLRFGRMPNRWGLGMVANAGECWDCDHGDNVDRIMFETEYRPFTFAVAYDFAGNGPTSLSVASRQTYFGGQAIDLEQLDDVHQWVFMAGRMEPDDVIQDRVDRGELVLNYGLYFAYRLQDFGYTFSPNVQPYGSSDGALAGALLERHMWTVMPDLWFKLIWKFLSIEAEGVLIAGKIGNPSNDNVEDIYDILQYGFTLRSAVRLLGDSLRIGLEVGMASGDSAEPNNADISRRRWNPLGLNADGSRIDTSGALNEMRFDYDYHVDLILFRELLGTVSNAVYFKPWAQYLVVDSFGARLDMIYSMAHQPVGFPGNSRNLGVELDLDIFYRNVDENFYAGLAYGVLFPLGALDRPVEIFGANDAANAGVAHTVQGRLIVTF